jgi:hypothetical protein
MIDHISFPVLSQLKQTAIDASLHLSISVASIAVAFKQLREEI